MAISIYETTPAENLHQAFSRVRYTVHLMFTFCRAYPWQTFIMLLALLFAGFAEGIGLSALLPLINIAVRNNAINTDETAAPDSEYERLVSSFLNDIGINPSIGTMLAIIVIASVLKNILLLLANRQAGYTAAHIATDLRLTMLSAILKSSWEYFVSQPVGKLTNTLATEAQRSSQAFINGSLMITFAIQTLVYGAVAVALSWQAALACFVAGLLIVTSANSLVRMSRRAGKKQTTLLTSLVARLTDTLQSVKPLKAMGREYSANTVLAAETKKLNTTLQRQVLSTASLGATQDVLLAVAIVTGMFVALVQFEMPFTTVLVLAAVLGRMMRQFNKVQREYQKSVINESAFRSLQNTINNALATGEQFDTGIFPSLKDGVRFDTVDFIYGENRILDGLTLEIPSGSLTTLIGPSGAGKTTIIDLVTGLLQPRSGCILIDNVPLSELDIKTWREMIGYVPQESNLFHSTVLHNITLGDPGLSNADAKRALKDAGAWEFVTALPEGMDSIVGERGEKLSGGQRQRIMIARALIRNPELLILDEATSALDPDSEAAVLETIERLRGKLTLLAISHQRAMVDAADRVYRLENGHAVMTNVTLPQAMGG